MVRFYCYSLFFVKIRKKRVAFDNQLYFFVKLLHLPSWRYRNILDFENSCVCTAESEGALAAKLQLSPIVVVNWYTTIYARFSVNIR